jgi:two-component system KDP operon response regulator KdpE
MSAKVLVVEDDRAIQHVIHAALSREGYDCLEAYTGSEALRALSQQHPDVMLLDLGLPDMDGADIIRAVKPDLTCPIIVVSARTQDEEKVEALDAGADDYLTKPFSIPELLARIRVATRRMHAAPAAERRFVNGELVIDYDANTVFVGNEEIHLTPMEYRLLCLLAQNVGKVLTHGYILREIWGSTLESDITSLRVFMVSLRKKIERDPSNPVYIQTRVGVGYRMNQISED